MRCNKCGFISFDYLTECKKCGIDLTVIRDGLGLSPVRPNISFLLGPLLKDYAPSREERVEPFENNLLKEDGESDAAEIQFGDDLDLSTAPADEPRMETGESPAAAVETPPEATLQELETMEMPELVLDEEPQLEPSLSVDASDEQARPSSGAVLPEDLLERNTDLDLEIELMDTPVAHEKELHLEEGAGPGEDGGITLESPASLEESLEAGDDDLLELILEDDELVFTLESEDEKDVALSVGGSKERRKAKNDIPSIEDINEFVLGLMAEDSKKK